MGCGADREGKPAGMDGFCGQTSKGAVSTCPDRVQAATCASHTRDGKTISDEMPEQL